MDPPSSSAPDDASAQNVALMSLVQALENGDAILFAGAGVSMSAPAGLPNWLQLRDWTLEAVASRAQFLAPYLRSLTDLDMLAMPGRRGMTPEVVASEIARRCSGYFESLRVLDEGSPNSHHKVIAQLAASARIRAVVTTNFDVFIERALDEAGVPFDRYRSQAEFARYPIAQETPSRFSVLKIHGCVTQPETIIATVETQSRGLAEHQRFALRWLQERCHFLYWGYSGWDLKVNLDYLATVSAKDRSPGFFWSLHSEGSYVESASPYVQELARLYGNRSFIGHNLAIRAAEQSLRIAGGTLPESVNYSHAELEAWRAARNQRLRERLTEWSQKFVSDVDAVLIFANLLEIAGKLDEALACFGEADRIAGVRKDYELAALSSLGVGQVWAARGDWMRALQAYRRTEAIASNNNDQELLSATLAAIGRTLTRVGRQEAALANLKQAARIASAIGNTSSAAHHIQSIGEIQTARNQYEDALESFQRAEKLLRAEGQKRYLSTCLTNQGVIYRTWGRWDDAEGCFGEALAIARDVIGDQGSVFVARLFLASVSVACKDFDSPRVELTSLEETARRSGLEDLLLKTLPYLILIEQHRGSRERSKALQQEYIELLRENAQPALLSTALANFAGQFVVPDDPAAALTLYEEALQLALDANDQLRAALVYENMGDLCSSRLGNVERAVRCFLRSISCHRRVEQDGGQFVPKLLQRIAECKKTEHLARPDLIDAAVASEPLIRDLVSVSRNTERANVFEEIYEVVHAIHRAAHQHAESPDICLSYLRAELPLATAIGYEHQIANIQADTGWMHVIKGEFDQAIPLIQSAAAGSKAVGDASSEIFHRANLGFALSRSGKETEGLKLIDDATSLARETHNDDRLLWLLCEQGKWYKAGRDLRGVAFLKEAIAVSEQQGNLALSAELSFDVGKLYRDNGQFEDALEYRLQGIRGLEILGQPVLAPLIVVASMLEKELARPAEAIPFYERAMALCVRDDRTGVQLLESHSRALSKLPTGGQPTTPVFDALVQNTGGTAGAATALRRWTHTAGLKFLAEVPTVASRVAAVGRNTLRAVGEVMLASAGSMLSEGNPQAALDQMHTVAGIAENLGDRQWWGTVRRNHGDVYLALGRRVEAMTMYADAERIADITGNTHELDLTRYTMAGIAMDDGDLDGALRHIEGALAAARSANDRLGAAHDQLRLADILRLRGDLASAEQSLREAIPVFGEARIASSWVEASIKHAEVLLGMQRADEALEELLHVEPVIQRGGTPMARQRVSEDIARARELAAGGQHSP